MKIDVAKTLSFSEVIKTFAKENNLNVLLFTPCAYKYVSNEVGGFICDPYNNIDSAKQPEEILEMLWAEEELALEYVEYFQNNNDQLDTVGITMYEALDSLAFGIYLWTDAIDASTFDYNGNSDQYDIDAHKMLIEIEFNQRVNIDEINFGSLTVSDNNRSTMFEPSNYSFVNNKLFVTISGDFDYILELFSDNNNFNMELTGTNTEASIVLEEVILTNNLSFISVVSSSVLKYADKIIPLNLD